MTVRVRLTKNQHFSICLKHKVRPEWTHNELAEWFRGEFSFPKRPAKQTISDIMKTNNQLSQLSANCLVKKCRRSTHMLKLDEIVVEFVIEAELSKVAVSSREIIRVSSRLVNELEIPERSRPRFIRSGWLRHLMARHNLRYKRVHGEIGSVNVEAAMRHVQKLREMIAQFHPNDVYNMDEAALFYRVIPRTSVCLNPAPALKQDKARATMIVGANASGTDKLPLFPLGKLARSRWVLQKPDDIEHIGTSERWLTVGVFKQWLTELNERMEREERRVFLLVDNAPSHGISDMDLCSVKVLKLPPNTTALLQPMDQGVIASLKREYRSLKTEVAVARFLDGDKDPYNTTLLDGIEMCLESWNSVSTEMIKNCWGAWTVCLCSSCAISSSLFTTNEIVTRFDASPLVMSSIRFHCLAFNDSGRIGISPFFTCQQTAAEILFRPHGTSPVTPSRMHIASEWMSVVIVGRSLRRCSGDFQWTAPIFFEFTLISTLSGSELNPKSMSFACPSAPTRMLSHFRSLWTMLRLCMCWSPSATSCSFRHTTNLQLLSWSFK